MGGGGGGGEEVFKNGTAFISSSFCTPLKHLYIPVVHTFTIHTCTL